MADWKTVHDGLKRHGPSYGFLTDENGKVTGLGWMIFWESNDGYVAKEQFEEEPDGALIEQLDAMYFRAVERRKHG